VSRPKVPTCYAICPDANWCETPAVHVCPECRHAYCSTHVVRHMFWREGRISFCPSPKEQP